MNTVYNNLIAKLKSIGKDYDWDLLDKHLSLREAHEGQKKPGNLCNTLACSLYSAEMEWIQLL